MTKPKDSSRAEKRALWEVRQRYNIDEAAAGRTSSSRRPVARAGVPLSPSARPSRSRQPLQPWLKRGLLGLILAMVLGGGVFGYKILAASNKISTTDRSILGQLKDLLFTQGNTLAGEGDDRVNILLIAVGGQGHSGQDLADTIMVASIRPRDGAVGLVSIPRDLYVQVPGEEYFTKINAVHAYGEGKKKGQGPELLQKKVEEITGVPMHYYARIDFTAFKQIVDAVGGINITIDNSFYDYWHKIAFSAGTEKMDGERALAYVRARYIEGPEGGDFKRAARQQQVLLALREKVFSVNTAFDFTAANSILNSLSDNIRTDMELWEMKRFYEFARQIDQTKIHSVVLTTGPKGVLVGSTEVLSGVPASILKPRVGDYSEIQGLVSALFATENQGTPAAPDEVGGEAAPAPESSPTPTPTPAPKPSVEIRNGTNITGLAREMQTRLEGEGYTITGIGNAATRTVTETKVYALKANSEAGARELAEFLETSADVDLPEGESESSATVLVILGEDAQ